MASSTISFFSSPPQAAPAHADAFSLRLLSAHLGRLLDPAFLDRADAEIVLAVGGGEPGGAVVGAYSCFLAARSSFLHHHILSLPAGDKLRLELAELVPGGCHIGREALMAVLGYMYTGRFEVPPQDCVDDKCRHGACRPAIDFVIESTYAASGFQIPELVSLCQRRLSDFVEMVFDEDVIPILRVASTCQLPDLLDQCIQRVAVSTLYSRYLEKELPGDTYGMIMEIRQSKLPDESDNVILDERENTVRSIHKALDSDDVGLVGRHLKESAVTLDEALALAVHYAAACCEPKVLAELLKLDSVYLDLKNNSGYTPLHMACIRLEPDIILSLVVHGASVLVTTTDGRDALTICKRLTRQKDMNREFKKGQEKSNAYLCIDILEQELKRKSFILDSISEEETIVTPLLVDNFHAKLAYLEIRVSCAKIFYPSEAKLAMRIAEVDSTEAFTGTNMSKLKEVCRNENPTTMQNRRLRLDALTRTVKLGRWFFPTCSDVIDKFLDEESNDLAFLESGTPEDQRIKKMRYYELKEEVQKAFDKDKAVASTSLSLEMSTPGTRSSQAAGAIDSADAPAMTFGHSRQAPSAGTASGQLESQGSDAVVDAKFGGGSKRKLKSAVWDEFKRIDSREAKCTWCHKVLSACTTNGTTHLHRHLNSCRSRQAKKT